MPISIEDIRQKISLNLRSAKKILDFKIVKQIDSDVAKFGLNKQGSNSLDLSWKYFDPGFAFKFQIIYTGYENPQFFLSGKILDISQFEKIEQVYATQPNTILIVELISISISLLGFIILKWVDKKIINISWRSKLYFLISMLTLSIVCLAFVVYALMSHTNIPLTN